MEEIICNSLIVVKTTLNNRIEDPIQNLFIKQARGQVIKFSIGFIFTIKKKPFIITCYHGVKNSLNIKLFHKNKKYNGCIHTYSDELDIALLSIDKTLDVDLKKTIKSSGLKYFDLNILNKSKSKIFTINIDKFINKKKTNVDFDFDVNFIECEIMNIKLEKYNSLNLPHMPYINVKIKNDYDDISELNGLSGSLVINDNKIIGMVSNAKVDNSQISLIPTFIFKRFINEIEINKTFQGVCTIVGKFSICEYKNENIKYNGIYVEDCYDINYNNFDFIKKESLMVGRNLKTGDIIYEINNKFLNDKGEIYDDNIKISINYQTYISLNYKCGDLIPLKILRERNVNDYREKILNVKARPISSLKYIPVSFNNFTLNHKGFVFMEVSEDLIDKCRKNGIDICKSIFNQYCLKPYRNEKKHIIVLIDIERDKINEYCLEQIDKIGLPFVNNNNNEEYDLAVVRKFNKRKVNTLESLKTLIKKEIEFTIYMGIRDKIKIKFINGDVSMIVGQIY